MLIPVAVSTFLKRLGLTPTWEIHFYCSENLTATKQSLTDAGPGRENDPPGSGQASRTPHWSVLLPGRPSHHCRAPVHLHRAGRGITDSPFLGSAQFSRLWTGRRRLCLPFSLPCNGCRSWLIRFSIVTCFMFSESNINAQC